MILLRTSPTSPFGRKTKIAAQHLGLMDRVEVVRASATDPNDQFLRRDNPLGKMPVALLEDGRRVYDSRVIMEMFDHMAGSGKILPVEWDARLAALTQQAMGDGIIDAGLLIVYEARHRPPEIQHKWWVDYQFSKIERSLVALEKDAPDATQVTVGTIALASALDYMTFRKLIDWRGRFPSLVAWLDTFRAHVPAFDKTTPVEMRDGV
jgi:glutathione S-transferase